MTKDSSKEEQKMESAIGNGIIDDEIDNFLNPNKEKKSSILPPIVHKDKE